MRVTITLSEEAASEFAVICSAPMYKDVPVSNVAAAVFWSGLADWRESFVGRHHAETLRLAQAEKAKAAAAKRKGGKS
jgi:hypothetical protein